MKRPIFSIFIIIVMAACLLAGCNRGPEEIIQDQELIDAQVYQPETVYIGGLLPFTGSYAQESASIRAAWEVAADIINNKHDLDWDMAKSAGIAGYGSAKVELVWGDCEDSVISAARAAEELIDMGVVTLLGAYHTDYTAAAAQRAHAHKLPMICGSAKTAKLTDGESYTFASHFNRLAPTDALESEQFFSYLKYLNQTQNAGIAKIAIAYINNTYGQHVLEIFNTYAQMYGFEVVARIVYEPDTQNVAVEVQKMISNEPDVIFQASSLTDLILFADAYGASGYLPQLALCYSGGFQSADFTRAVGANGLDYFAGVMICPSLAEPEENAEPDNTAAIFAYINSLYKQKTGQDMDNTALLEFSSVIVAAQAIAKAGCSDGDILSQTLKTNTFPAPYLYGNSIAFNELGQDTVMPGYIAQVVGGQYTQVY